jgi:DNA-binding CsgD family transcriptional regulator
MRKLFFTGNNSIILKFGLLTGFSIIGFQILTHFLIYNYFTFDYYLSFVAVCFLLVGLKLKTPKEIIKEVPIEIYLEAPVQNKYQTLLSELTTTEILIFKLIAEGKSNKEIAAINHVEISTIKTHINNLYAKLSVLNRKEVRVKFFEMSQSGLNL